MSASKPGSSRGSPEFIRAMLMLNAAEAYVSNLKRNLKLIRRDLRRLAK